MMNSIFIREAEINDSAVIADFQLRMALETESLELVKEVVEKGVEAVFKNPSLGKYYVAHHGEKVVASLLTTYEWSDWRNSTVWWIQSVYVMPTYRRKGLFSRFYQYLTDAAMNNSEVGGIRLYVDKTNLIAQKTYTKVGMNGEHYQLFEWLK